MFLSVGIMAQGNNQGIRDAADDDKNNSGNTNSGSNSNSGGSNSDFTDDDDDDDGSGGCLSDACSGCSGAAIGAIFAGLWEYNLAILDMRYEVPRVLSLDLIAQGGVNFEESYQMAPRIRVNAGVFSMGFRYFANIETGVGYQDVFRTLDWQILGLNLVAVEPFNLRYGHGIMWEPYTGRAFYEMTLGADVYIGDLAVTTEGRYARNYEAKSTPRWEINGMVNYKVLDSRLLSMYAGFGGYYQRYYNNSPLRVKLYALHGGLWFNLHSQSYN